MAGGGAHSTSRPAAAPSGPAQITPDTVYSGQAAPAAPASNMAQARTFADGGIAGLYAPQSPAPMFNTQSGYNNYAAPNNSSFMQYPQQGQPNQPPQGINPPSLTSGIPPVQNDGGPDAGANYAGNSMGFDNSGSDAGIGGQPVTQVQSPLQSTTKPAGLSNFMSPQGLQVQGNPTSQPFNRGSRSV